MKFLCVDCDEAMKLERTVGPDEGSLSVVFSCPKCGRQTAMLTNAMETQMVRSLGVKIGGRKVAAEPMEMVRGSLAHGRDSTGTDASSAAAGETSGSKCPFADVVDSAFTQPAGSEIAWTKEAEDRFSRIPDFARPMVRKGVEAHARDRGYTEIDEAVMDEAKNRYGM